MAKTTKQSTNTKQAGFSVIELLIILVVVSAFVFAGWRVFKHTKVAKISGDISQLQNREYTAYLDGATDDRLVNYYTFGLNIKVENSNANIVDPGFSVDPLPCPEVQEDYSIAKSYQGNTLTVKVENYQRVENPKGLLENDPKCKSLTGVGSKQFKLDKSWLASAGDKTIKVEGLQGADYTLTTGGYKLSLKKGNQVSSLLPYYPDGVAVMIAWGDSCPQDSKTLVTQAATDQGLSLADAKYPGLEAVYRRPKREVDVLLNGLKDTDTQKYRKDLGGDCYTLTTKPNLKDLRQTGLPYQ